MRRGGGVMNIEPRAVSPASLLKLGDGDLESLHSGLHRLWEAEGRKKNEVVFNAHALTEMEAKRRGIKWPEPDDGLATALSKGPTFHEDRLKAIKAKLPELIVLNPNWASLTGSSLYSAPDRQPNDVDIVVPPGLDSGAYLKLQRAIVEAADRPVQLITENNGSSWAHAPLYRLVAQLIPGNGIVRPDEGTEVESMLYKGLIEDEDKIVPGKAHAIYEAGGEFDNGEEDEVTEWGMNALVDGVPVYVQEKYDGQRLVVHKDGEKVWIFTGDSGRDRAETLKPVADLVRKLPFDKLILDAEFVQMKGSIPLPRVEMLWIINGKEWQGGATVQLNVHDVTYQGDKNMAVKPYSERIGWLLDNRSKLTASGPGARMQIAPTRVARDKGQLLDAVIWASLQEGSEGAMLKRGDYPYKIQGANQGVVKYKVLLEIDGAIIGYKKQPAPRPAGEKWSREQALAKLPGLLRDSDTYLLRIALDYKGRKIAVERDGAVGPGDLELDWSEEKQEWTGTDGPESWKMAPGWSDRKEGDVPYGSTYAVKLDSPPKFGEIVTISPAKVQVFSRDSAGSIPADFKPEAFDPKLYGLAWEFPRVRNTKPDKTKPGDLIEVLRRAGGAMIPRTKAVKFASCQRLRKQATMEHYLNYPTDGEKRYPAVFQFHFRGKTVHGDLRCSKGDYLAGWTLMLQRPGALKNPVESLADARKAAKLPNAFKIDPKTGVWAQRRIADGTIRRTGVNIALKAPQPSAWLKVQGVIKPGGVGATANYPGVFLILDSFEIEWGALKPEVLEVFCYGKLFKGRYFFRPLVIGKRSVEEAIEDELGEVPEFGKVFILPPSEEQSLQGGPTWLMIRPDDQTPNVLAKSSVAEKPWIPPKGFSALPSAVKAKVPDDLRYWLQPTEKGRMMMRAKLIETWTESQELQVIIRPESG